MIQYLAGIGVAMISMLFLSIMVHMIVSFVNLIFLGF